MKNKLLLLCSTLSLCLTTAVFAQNGRDNWFPNKGSVGIGTRTPSKDLEVIGDVNVTGTTTSGAVQTTTLQSSNFLNLNNAIINGRVGIGVSNPSVALDVLGNFNLQGNITAQGVNFQTLNVNTGTFGTLTVNQNGSFGGTLSVTKNITSSGLTTTTLNTINFTTGLATFNDNATFVKNIILNGKLGIGVASPVELLEVGGNIKSTSGLFSQSLTTGNAQLNSLLVSQNSTFNGLVGIGTNTPAEKLHVAGNIKADNTITSSNLNATNVQAGQLNSGVATFSDNISVNKNVLITGQLGIGVPTPTESLDINGNIKLTGAISASSLNVSQGSFPQGLTAGNTTVNGTMGVTGQLSAQSLSLSDISATNNVSVGNTLAVTGASQLNGGATSIELQLRQPMIWTVNSTLNAKRHAMERFEYNWKRNCRAGLGSNWESGQFGSDVIVTGQLSAQSLSLSDVRATNNVSVGNTLAVTGASQLNGGATIGGSTTANNLQVNGTLER